MQLSFVALALAIAGTASAASIEPRNCGSSSNCGGSSNCGSSSYYGSSNCGGSSSNCISEQEATVQFTGFSGPAHDTCDLFVRRCERLVQNKSIETVDRKCAHLKNDRFTVETKCVIANNNDGTRISYTYQLADDLKLRNPNFSARYGSNSNGRQEICRESVDVPEYRPRPSNPDYRFGPSHPNPNRPSNPDYRFGPSHPNPNRGGNQRDCIDEERATDRFFIANIGAGNENETCGRFNDACYALNGNGDITTSPHCAFSEVNIIKASCIGRYNTVQTSVSLTRQVAKGLGLGLSVNATGMCNQVPGGKEAKCAERDFDPKVADICRRY